MTPKMFPITAQMFFHLVEQLGDQALQDIEWAESISPPSDPDVFAQEAIFVICNSGMKNTVARGIFHRCMVALGAGEPVFEVFRHPGKAAAIEHIWANKAQLLDAYLQDQDKLANVAALPWIGNITKYHLAKNFGAEVAKPDVHLQRLADREACTAQQLCERLARETGFRVATVDTVLWRACANGVLDSRSGNIQSWLTKSQATDKVHRA